MVKSENTVAPPRGETGRRGDGGGRGLLPCPGFASAAAAVSERAAGFVAVVELGWLSSGHSCCASFAASLQPNQLTCQENREKKCPLVADLRNLA